MDEAMLDKVEDAFAELKFLKVKSVESSECEMRSHKISLNSTYTNSK